MRSMYRIVLVTQLSNLEYDYSNYKELLAEDEEDSIFRWANLFNISFEEITQISKGHWVWNNARINVELAYMD